MATNTFRIADKMAWPHKRCRRHLPWISVVLLYTSTSWPFDKRLVKVETHLNILRQSRLSAWGKALIINSLVLSTLWHVKKVEYLLSHRQELYADLKIKKTQRNHPQRKTFDLKKQSQRRQVRYSLATSTGLRPADCLYHQGKGINFHCCELHDL